MVLKSRGSSGINTRYCNDCKVKFSVLGRRKRKIYYCPICGDDAGVTTYEDRKANKYERRYWTVLEIRRLTEMVNKGMLPVEMEMALERSAMAIKHKVTRLGLGKFE